MEWVAQWWRRPDRYDWFSAYLAEHRTLRAARFTMAGITTTFAAVAAVTLTRRSGPHTVVFQTTALTAGRRSCGRRC